MRRLVVTVVAVAAAVVGCSSETPDATATLDALAEAYDAQDLDGVVTLFAADSVMVGHPAGPFAVGVDDIRSVFADDVAQGISMAISNVTVEEFAADEREGLTAPSFVVWDQTWTSDGNGEPIELCRSGHTAVISDGTIYRLNWSRMECP